MVVKASIRIPDSGSSTRPRTGARTSASHAGQPPGRGCLHSRNMRKAWLRLAGRSSASGEDLNGMEAFHRVVRYVVDLGKVAMLFGNGLLPGKNVGLLADFSPNQPEDAAECRANHEILPRFGMCQPPRRLRCGHRRSSLKSVETAGTDRPLYLRKPA